jgi:hypothetical protein
MNVEKIGNGHFSVCRSKVDRSYQKAFGLIAEYASFCDCAIRLFAAIANS